MLYMKNHVLLFLLLTPFVAMAQDVSISFQNQADGAFLVEGCSEIGDTIILTRSTADSASSYNLALSGTATAGTDYIIGGQNQITFDSGQTVLRIPIDVISDTDAEDRETILISVSDAGTVIASAELLILDELEVVIEQEAVNVCQGVSVTLNTVIPGSYMWVLGPDTIEGSEVTFIASDEMTVKVLTSLGSCETSDQIDIKLRAGITFNVEDTAYACLGEMAVVTVDIIGNPAGDYVWSPLDSTITVLADQSIQVTTDQTKTYYLMFRNNECVVNDSVVVRIDSLPDLPITVIPEKDSYCPGEKVTLFSRYLYPPNFPDVTFKWDYDAGSPISADTLQNFTFTTEDTSYYRLTATNNACEVTDSVLLYVINPPVNLSLTDTTVCPNQPVKVVLLNADDFDEIKWSPEEGISCTECADPVIRVSQTTTFTVTGMSMGCPASGSVNINITPPDLIEVQPDTAVCPGEPVTLFAPGANAIYEELEWTGSNLSCEKCASPTATPSTSSIYQVFGQKPDGCMGQGGISIETFTNPNPVVGTDPRGPVELGTAVTASSGLGPDNTFTWFVNGQQVEGMESQVQVIIPSEGTNTIKVEVLSPEGCMGMGETTIEGNPPKYEIPSAFTPNNDDLNDKFKVLIFGNLQLKEFKIFNRWGQIVYEGVNEEGWDGRHDGEASPADVYAYQAVLELLDGSSKTIRGEVTLIR